MKRSISRNWGLAALLGVMLAGAASASAGDDGVRSKVHGALSVLVLGSGGPAANDDGRASAGYLIFTDGKPRILMDAGGGTFQRLAASGVNIKDLDIVLLSHLHVDHTSDLPAMVKTIYFHNRAAGTTRSAPIRIYGPGANGVGFPKAMGASVAQYPSTREFVDGQFSLDKGVDRYLHVFARAIGAGKFAYQAHDISADPSQGVHQVLSARDGLKVEAIGVKHGPAPALAYRIEYKGHSLAFSGDTSSATKNLVAIGRHADMLIYDTAILEDSPPDGDVVAKLHTRPSRMGQVATAAAPADLVLSHITAITNGHIDQVRKAVRKQGFRGTITEAEDLAVYNL